jgi:dinuclear metal center YbgI/SA1388 family protein
MKICEFDLWARERLVFSGTDPLDASLNGLQAGRMDMEVNRMAFAVDACMDAFRRARDESSQAVFVHHGLFWGPAVPLTGVMGERVRFLMRNDMALYACHLPLDRHPQLGNNAGIAKALGLENVRPFGLYKGEKIGFKGTLPELSSLESITERLFGGWDSRMDALRFGPEGIRSVGVISGGGTHEVSQAIDEGLDLYITGDASHNVYHECREAGINVLFAGHYLTEVFGVRAAAEAAASELGIETLFLDIPTGY